MPEIAELPGPGETHQFFRAAGINGIQRKRRARRQQVADAPGLLVTAEKHANFHRHIAIDAVVEQDILTQVRRGNQLSHQSVIIDVNIMNKAIHLIARLERDAHQSAKDRNIQLRYPAADHAAGRTGAQ
ncbi:MAG TPA: hypothetical protein DCP32_01635 [Anaerolineaceae bacterium]|nr:hypothetical protein [Anaerolineaceae bacterium]